MNQATEKMTVGYLQKIYKDLKIVTVLKDGMIVAFEKEKDAESA